MILRAMYFAAVVTTLACGQSVDSGVTGVFFPRHSVRGPTPAALIEGRLDVKDGCLWIVDASGTRYLAIWPSGWRVTSVGGRIHVVNAEGRLIVADGDSVAGGGGETVTADNAHRLMGQTEPAACRTNSFWLVGQLGPGSPASPAPIPSLDAEPD